MFGIGVQEMAFLAIIALLVFGPKRLPELARTLGKGLAEFRRASADLRGALSLEPDPPHTPPSIRKKKGEEVDPLEDRDFSGVPGQPMGGPDSSVDPSINPSVDPSIGTGTQTDAEAANQALLEDESNDTRHGEDESQSGGAAEVAPDDVAPSTTKRTD